MDPDCSSLTHNRADYGSKKCTCEQGRAANAEYSARKKAEHKGRTESQTAAYRAEGWGDQIPSLQHGAAITREWRGCTCKDCVDAARTRWRNAQSKSRYIKKIRSLYG